MPDTASRNLILMKHVQCELEVNLWRLHIELKYTS